MSSRSGPFFRKELGQRGEEAAAMYLKKRGYKILCRNYRCALGEIDIVARHGSTVVFIEVKTRRSSYFGPPQEAVSAAKQRKISRVALDFIQRNGLENRAARFDVAAVIATSRGYDVEVIENAFDLPPVCRG